MSEVKHLEVTVVSGNCKRMDPKAYGVTDRSAWIRLKLGDQVKDSKRVDAPTLDPIWEEILEFDVADPSKDELTATFFLGELQIGNPTTYKLDELVFNKHTFKGMPVFGGKCDLTFRAKDFGKEDKPVEYSFMDDMF